MKEANQTTFWKLAQFGEIYSGCNEMPTSSKLSPQKFRQNDLHSSSCDVVKVAWNLTSTYHSDNQILREINF